jgi:hypothetical protein
VRVRVRGWLTSAVVWLLAVAVVAAVAWFAIDSAGRQVAGADHAITLVSAVQPSPAVGAGPANVTPTPASSPSAPGAERPEPGIDAGTPIVTPSGTPSVPGSGSGRTGTHSSAGGDIAVRCVGGTAAGWTTRVADGWRIEQAAPQAGGGLLVRFVARDGRTDGVRVNCQNGPPSFSPAR